MLQDAPYELYESVFKTGSSVICNPPVTNTDEDFMFYTEGMEQFRFHLLINGWKDCTGEGYDTKNTDVWCALRKGNLNYLLTDSIRHYEKFEIATKLATKLNLLEKNQRIALFNYVCNGVLE